MAKRPNWERCVSASASSEETMSASAFLLGPFSSAAMRALRAASWRVRPTVASFSASRIVTRVVTRDGKSHACCVGPAWIAGSKASSAEIMASHGAVVNKRRAPCNGAGLLRKGLLTCRIETQHGDVGRRRGTPPGGEQEVESARLMMACLPSTPAIAYRVPFVTLVHRR